METIHVADAWHTTFAGGHVGLLLVGPVDNSRQASPLDEHKRSLETAVRQKYANMTRTDLQQIDNLKAYKSYYRNFNKTYHVQLQFELVVQKGKALPSVNPPVDACFAAELETHLLTASHDADKLVPPVTIDASTGRETLHMMNGEQKQIKAGDMMMTDAEGVVCTIIYGQDKRTPVTVDTERVLYVTYAPAGIARTAVDLVGVPSNLVNGASGLAVHPDYSLAQLHQATLTGDYSLLIIPGSSSWATTLLSDPRVHRAIKRTFTAGGFIAAMSAIVPKIVANSGLLEPANSGRFLVQGAQSTPDFVKLLIGVHS